MLTNLPEFECAEAGYLMTGIDYGSSTANNKVHGA